jgi:predicted transcriptional regulator
LPLDDALNAFGLFAGVRYRFLLDKAIAMLMLRRRGELQHRITVRLSDAHRAHLDRLASASGFTRNEVMRRVLVNTEIPSARARRKCKTSSGFNASRTGSAVC